MRRMATAFVVTVVLLAGGVIAQQKRQQDIDLQAAIRTETVDGDLNGAIKQYGAIVSKYKADRAVTAAALVHMAECYQKLGDAQARQIFEQVVREFADQAIATEARTRLAAMGTSANGSNLPARATGDRMVWDGSAWAASNDGRVSLDGRYISYIDYELTGNLMLHDLVAGTDRPLTGNKDWSVGAAYSSTFSRDGRQLAYGWRTFGQQGGPHVNDLRIITIEGAASSQPRRVYGSADIDIFYPTDWSPDGKSLAVRVARKDRTGQIAIVGVDDGSFRALKTVGWRGPGKIFFSPDGKYLTYDLPASDEEQQRDVFIMAVDGSREARVVHQPANDIVMGWSPDGSRLLFESDRAGAVGLWALPVAEGTPSAAPMLLKPDIGSALPLGLTASGTMHVVKDASTQSLQIAPIDLERGRLTGPAVLENFRNQTPDWSPDGRWLVYASNSPSGVKVLSIRSLESGRLREVQPALLYFPSPKWLPDLQSVVTFGRDLKGRNGIYQIDVQTGTTSLLVDAQDINQVQLSPDGKKIYYTLDYFIPTGGTARFVERDLKSGEVRELFRRPPNAGGNVLSPDGRSVVAVSADKQAKVSRVLLMPVAGGEPRELLRVSLPDEFQTFGGVEWTPDSRAVLVMKMNGPRQERKELWLVPVSGTGARKLDIDISAWASTGIRLHPSGRQIAFFTGRQVSEVWALENFLPVPAPKK